MNSFLTSVYNGATPPLKDWVEALGSDFPLLHELVHTPQDAKWHAEGDVFVHTAMVLEQAYARLRNEAAALDADRRFALVLAAVFHDIAKPLTTREQDFSGVVRIVAPRHADRGRSWLAWALPGQVPFPIAQQVLALVGHHHDVLRLVVEGRPAREYRRLARLADTELLYHLEAADIAGRVSLVCGRELELVELFRLYCEDYRAWTRAPYTDWEAELYSMISDIDEATQQFIVEQSVRDFEDGLISTPHEAAARSFSYRSAYSRLVVLCGPAGCGKSTWAASAYGDYSVVSLDALRRDIVGDTEDQSKNGQVLQAAKEQLREHLRKRRKVVWDATNVRRELRSGVLKLGFDYKAHVSLVVFYLAKHELYRRNNERERCVARNVIERQVTGMEWPYAHEAHRLLVVY